MSPLLSTFQRDPTTKNIFPSHPLSTFCRDHSLHDSLVSSTLPMNPFTTPGRPNADSGTGLRSISVLHAPTNLTFLLPSTLPPPPAPLVTRPSLASSTAR
eukprot:g30964.t1